jgi:hypothetical protein
LKKKKFLFFARYVNTGKHGENGKDSLHTERELSTRLELIKEKSVSNKATWHRAARSWENIP